MAEYRVKVSGTNVDSSRRPQVTVRNIAELNANLPRIESMVTAEIARYLPKSISVSAVAVQFMVDALALEATVTFTGEAKDISELQSFLLNLPRLVFERLPRILSEAGIVRLDYIPNFQVTSGPVDPLPLLPKNPPQAASASVASSASATTPLNGNNGVDWWNRAMQIVIIVLACCAVVLVIVATVAVVRLAFSTAEPIDHTEVGCVAQPEAVQCADWKRYESGHFCCANRISYLAL